VKVDNGASAYCLKEDTRLDGPWEFGNKPIQRNNIKDWDKVRQLAKEGKHDEIPSDIFIRFYSSIKAITKDNLVVNDRKSAR